MPLVALSRQCEKNVEQAAGNVAQMCVVFLSYHYCVTDGACSMVAYWDYFTAARALFIDQISSRSLGNTPLQGLLQSNARFRCGNRVARARARLTASGSKFASGQVAKAEEWFLARGIQTHGHLGSVLYAPVQRLPRVLLLALRYAVATFSVLVALGADVWRRMRSLWPDAPGLSNLIELVQALLSDFEFGK